MLQGKKPHEYGGAIMDVPKRLDAERLLTSSARSFFGRIAVKSFALSLNLSTKVCQYGVKPALLRSDQLLN